MGYGVGAGGFIGLAVETTPGTYIAPTIYLPLLDESINYTQKQIDRRPLRGIADSSGMLPGDSNVAGDMKCEITHDTLPFILRAARVTIVKTGTGPYTYTCTPNANATPAQTFSITVVRNGLAFGYTGCIISSQEYTIDNGTLIGTFGVIGRDEASQSLPTPTYITTIPPATGQFALSIGGSVQTDADTFSLKIDDNADPQFRLQGGGVRSAVFVKFGQRAIEASINRDFQTRTDYDAYKAMTSQVVALDCVQTATSAEVHFTLPAAIKSAYEIQGLSGQADLIRANIKYNGTYDTGTSRAYQIVVNSSSSITIP